MPNLLTGIFWQPRPKASQAQMETRFAIAEKRRNREFSASMLEYGRRFMDEEKVQWEGEKHRSATFDRLIAQLDEAAEAATGERDEAFREEEARRRDIFHGSEDLREKRFSQAEANRSVGFLKLQEMHNERAEWYAKIRESRFEHGRQEREETSQKMVKDMQEQLERLLRWEEECYTSAEQQRDKVIREIVNKGNFPHKLQGNDVRLPSQVSANDSKHHSPVDSDTPYPPYRTRVVSDSLSRYPSRRPTPLLHIPSFPDSPARAYHRPPVLPSRPSRSSVDSIPPLPPPKNVQSASHASPPSRRSSSGSRSNIQPALDVDEPEPISNLTADTFEGQFRFKEEQRQTEFIQEEGQRQLRFTDAEYVREEAERIRTTVLERLETSRDQAFQAMISMHRDSFEGSEASRGWREEWRTQESGAAEEHRAQSFRQALAFIKKQFHALSDLEADAVQCMKNKLEKLNKMHRVLFERARQQRSATFSLSQARRELELLIPLWKLGNNGGPVTRARERMSTDRRHLRRSRSRSWSRSVSPSARRPRARSRTRYSDAASVGSLSVSDLSSMGPDFGLSHPPGFLPPTGFHPRALFHETDLRQPLPVSGVYKHNISRNGSDDHRWRHLTFTKSQAERDELFENGVQHRRRIFDTNERQRELHFEQLQTKTMKVSVQRERERSIKFVDAQKARQAAFRDAERQRESNFRNAEIRRAERYKAAQADRDASFYSTQKMLQRQCFRSDYLRTSEFDEWASELLRQEEERQTGAYKADEKEREARFARAIERCAEQRAAGAHSALPE